MHQYQIIGINHRTANAALLGLVSLNGVRREVFLKKSNEKTAFDGFVLSTCNRTEVYFKNDIPQDILSIWAETVGLHIWPNEQFYHYHGIGAVEHLFRVACGMDSKILGDNEILGQLKEAFLFQKENYGISGIWERIVSTAIACSRQVREETNFNAGSISTPYRITKIIQADTDAEAPILLIGAGEMVYLTLKYLQKVLPKRKLVITNRSIEKAKWLAKEFGADYFHFGQLETEMRHFSAIISAIQVEKPLFDLGFFNENQRYLIFDLGIPCNFKAEVAQQHSYLDINTIADFNAAILEKRTKDVRKAAHIVAENVAQFEEWNRRRLHYSAKPNVEMLLTVSQKPRANSH